VTATFIAIPVLRGAGIGLGALIILAAVVTLMRYRSYRQLPPAVAFMAVIALVILTS
jgi:MFS superfamily sulfate permease-like transporter